MRIPRRKRISLIICMQHTKPVAITRIKHQLNRLALQLATTDPDQRANPCRHLIQFQNFSRRKRVEVADQRVEAVLMPLDSVQQRSNLTRAPAFIPPGKSRTEMQTKNARITSRRNNLQKRMTRARRIMPFVILDLFTTQEPDRVVSARCPERKLSGLGDTRNHRRISSFLEYDQIRSGCDDRFR